MNKLWSVHFCGVWPVGAVALVCTAPPHCVEEEFRAHMAVAMPNHDFGHLVIAEVKLVPKQCLVLLNGDY